MSADYEAIRRLVSIYGPLLDSRRMEEWGELFTEDAVFRVGGATYSGRAVIVEAFAAMQPDSPIQHAIFSPVIDLEEDGAARCWTDMAALVGSGEGVSVVTIARYYDEVVKSPSDRRWRFTRRVLVLSGDEVPADVFPLPAY